MLKLRGRDPWWADEGVGARRTRRRVQAESIVAIGLAIIACGVIAALWMRMLAPLATTIGLG
jgi:hypothetical protein